MSQVVKQMKIRGPQGPSAEQPCPVCLQSGRVMTMCCRCAQDEVQGQVLAALERERQQLERDGRRLRERASAQRYARRTTLARTQREVTLLRQEVDERTRSVEDLRALLRDRKAQVARKREEAPDLRAGFEKNIVALQSDQAPFYNYTQKRQESHSRTISKTKSGGAEGVETSDASKINKDAPNDGEVDAVSSYKPPVAGFRALVPFARLRQQLSEDAHGAGRPKLPAFHMLRELVAVALRLQDERRRKCLELVMIFPLQKVELQQQSPKAASATGATSCTFFSTSNFYTSQEESNTFPEVTRRLSSKTEGPERTGTTVAFGEEAPGFQDGPGGEQVSLASAQQSSSSTRPVDHNHYPLHGEAQRNSRKLAVTQGDFLLERTTLVVLGQIQHFENFRPGEALPMSVVSNLDESLGYLYIILRFLAAYLDVPLPFPLRTLPPNASQVGARACGNLFIQKTSLVRNHDQSLHSRLSTAGTGIGASGGGAPAHRGPPPERSSYAAASFSSSTSITTNYVEQGTRFGQVVHAGILSGPSSVSSASTAITESATAYNMRRFFRRASAAVVDKVLSEDDRSRFLPQKMRAVLSERWQGSSEGVKNSASERSEDVFENVQLATSGGGQSCFINMNQPLLPRPLALHMIDRSEVGFKLVKYRVVTREFVEACALVRENVRTLAEWQGVLRQKAAPRRRDRLDNLPLFINVRGRGPRNFCYNLYSTSREDRRRRRGAGGHGEEELFEDQRSTSRSSDVRQRECRQRGRKASQHSDALKGKGINKAKKDNSIAYGEEGALPESGDAGPKVLSRLSAAFTSAARWLGTVNEEENESPEEEKRDSTRGSRDRSIRKMSNEATEMKAARGVSTTAARPVSTTAVSKRGLKNKLAPLEGAAYHEPYHDDPLADKTLLHVLMAIVNSEHLGCLYPPSLSRHPDEGVRRDGYDLDSDSGSDQEDEDYGRNFPGSSVSAGDRRNFRDRNGRGELPDEEFPKQEKQRREASNHEHNNAKNREDVEEISSRRRSGRTSRQGQPATTSRLKNSLDENDNAWTVVE
ncbi:unnamed protein product [Amoebophrya sp. A25]|nr:unnamed protein product [Amoebophrya sp. A25]|eukprot:GSA25T00010544001.1